MTKIFGGGIKLNLFRFKVMIHNEFWNFFDKGENSKNNC